MPVFLTASMGASSAVEIILKRIVADVLDQATTKKRAGKTGPFISLESLSGRLFILVQLSID